MALVLLLHQKPYYILQFLELRILIPKIEGRLAG